MEVLTAAPVAKTVAWATAGAAEATRSNEPSTRTNSAP